MTRAKIRYVVGIDGGGSGCRVAIANLSGEIIGQASGGPANVTTDANQSIANLSDAILAAVQQAGLTESDLAAAIAHAGLAGVMTEQHEKVVSDSLPCAVARVTDDCITSATGALGPRDGILLAIGTGSTIATLRKGTFKRIGGWGFQLGDQASGAWLGRALLCHTLLCIDGLEKHSELTLAILREFSGDPNALVRFAKTARPIDYAQFSPQIVDATKSGDSVAQLLMKRGAGYLSDVLYASSFGKDDVLCLLGGLGAAYEAYLEPQARSAIMPALGSALDGALALAKQSLERMQE